MMDAEKRVAAAAKQAAARITQDHSGVTAALTAIAHSAHADATRRGILPQPLSRSVDDIGAEYRELLEAWANARYGNPDAKAAVADEAADVILATLTTLVELGVDPGRVIVGKWLANQGRGPRRDHGGQA